MIGDDNDYEGYDEYGTYWGDEEVWTPLETLEDSLLNMQELPDFTVLDLTPEEIQELIPGFIVPKPTFETVEGDNPDDPVILTSETYVPLPIMIEPSQMPHEVEEMLKWGENKDKEAVQLTDDLFYLADTNGDGTIWWSEIPDMFD